MDWKKIKTFDTLFQAELIREILEEQGVHAVVLNNRDSMFLIGDIELYVPEEQEKKALAIIDEFYGLTKINSFILEKPIINFKDFIESKGISTILKVRQDPNFALSNYEVYVKNEDFEKVKPYLNPKNIDGWKQVSVCKHIRQTQFRVELLQEQDIDTMVLKRKDSNYKLAEVYLLVKINDYINAQNILEQLSRWTQIAEYDKRHRAEIREELLAKNGIAAIIKEKSGRYYLYVKNEDKQKAIDLLNIHKKWIKIRSYSSLIDAQADQILLQKNDIGAAIVTLKDSMFLIGGYELYVDEDKVEKALKLLSKAE